MSIQSTDQPRCSVQVGGVNQCANEAVAKETLQDEDVEMDVWYCEEHVFLADDPEYLGENEH
jgi:hypothetical protein